MSPIARFASSLVVAPSGCWEWQLTLNRGYGRMHVNGEAKQAHVWAWEQERGPVPAGLVLDHLCRNRRCVNPAHLEPVTHRENLLRGETHAAANARKTHCPRGHELSGKNLNSRGDGARSCKECHRMNMAGQRLRNPEKHREAVRRHRAKAKLARIEFPEAALGLYST